MMTHTPMNRMRWIALIAVLLAALACTMPGQGQLEDAPTTAATPVPVLTTAPQTAEPAQPTAESPQPTAESPQATAEPGQPTAEPSEPTPFVPPDAAEPNAEYAGISFHYDLEYASEWQGETMPPPDMSTGAPVDWMTPSHYRFVLEGYPTATGAMHDPQILVIPTENYENFNNVGPREIAALTRILEERPTDLRGPVAGQDPLPFLPGFPAAQVFAARIGYLNFQNGTGIRYLTQYDQAVIPINNQELFYTYQGLTLDGAYYVAVILPIAHPDLLYEVTNEDYAAVEGNFEAHLEDVTTLLNDADPADFTPDLSLLDQLVQSIRVEP